MEIWAYLAIFGLVAIGWAGVPAIGGAVVGGAAVLASQGELNIAWVLAASMLGAAVGGLIGYGVGVRWGRTIMNHPGPWLNRRQQTVSAGEALHGFRHRQDEVLPVCDLELPGRRGLRALGGPGRLRRGQGLQRAALRGRRGLAHRGYRGRRDRPRARTAVLSPPQGQAGRGGRASGCADVSGRG